MAVELLVAETVASHAATCTPDSLEGFGPMLGDHSVNGCGPQGVPRSAFRAEAISQRVLGAARRRLSRSRDPRLLYWHPGVGQAEALLRAENLAILQRNEASGSQDPALVGMAVVAHEEPLPAIRTFCSFHDACLKQLDLGF